MLQPLPDLAWLAVEECLPEEAIVYPVGNAGSSLLLGIPHVISKTAPHIHQKSSVNKRVMRIFGTAHMVGHFARVGGSV
jgi:hypothetical protein